MQKTASKPNGPSKLVFALYLPLVMSLAGTLVKYAWQATGLVPSYLLADKTNLTVAIECAGLASVPLLASIIAVICFRALTPAGVIYTLGHSSQRRKPYYEGADKCGSEYSGELFYFCAESTSKQDFSQEKLVILTFLFIGSRFVFWLGYNLGYALKFPPLRAPGFIVGLILNGVLTAYNSYREFTAERLVGLTWFFVIGRIVFWSGYVLGTQLNMSFLRGLGFTSNLQVNVVMFAYNLGGFWS